MRSLHGYFAASAAIGVVLLFCGFVKEVKPRLSFPVIVTAAPAYDASAGPRGQERFAQGAQLLLLNNGNAQPLAEGFAASADASVSFDGKTVLFAGKKDAADRWSIWELTLGSNAVRRVIGGDTDYIRPMYLPDERLVYARRMVYGFEIQAARLDGSDALSLTYLNASALPVEVLADGRILFESAFPLGAGDTTELYLVYSDGSGVESYRCDHGSARWGGTQLASGDVVFTQGKTLARFTSPLGTEARIDAPRAEYAGGITEASSGEWLVSARPAATSPYSLNLWKPGAPGLKALYSQQGKDLVEAVLVKERERPHRHPSALHDWDYANLLALNARESRDGDLKASPAAVRLETLATSGNPVNLGTAPVDSDGSFFVKAPADKPIRFALLDANGAVLRQEHGWFWARRGEQRICVGCHTGPERAAENRVPEVLLHSTTPVDLTGTAKQAVLAGSR